MSVVGVFLVGDLPAGGEGVLGLHVDVLPLLCLHLAVSTQGNTHTYSESTFHLLNNQVLVYSNTTIVLK